MVVLIVVALIAAAIALWTLGAVASLLFALVPWAIVGLLTGWVAARLTGARLTPGWTMLAGIAGSWLGGALFTALLHVRVGGLLNPLHLVASVLGASIVIILARVLARPALPGPSHPRLGRTL